jgi:murein DD-endopeptidase MepM/ murein hydrolase activator NlpD
MRNKHPFVVVLVIGAMSICGVVLIVTSSAQATTIRLRPPFSGTYRQTAYLDHVQPFTTDGSIIIYNGEQTPDNSPYPYDGHEGNDWGMVTGTLVLAAEKGYVSQAGWQNPADHSQGYGLRVRVDHQTGYETLYGHLSNLIANQGDQVAEGDTIAYSGSTGHSTGPHLHLSVYHNGNLTDPFGWRGSGRDPLSNYNGETSLCLWRNLDEGPISCADTIVEDDGSGFSLSGDWLTNESGNGYHMSYRRNITDSNVYANWLSTVAGTGQNKIYAYIPSQYATTHQATYNIWTGSTWETSAVSQQNYTDTWVLLGTYQLPAHYAFVFMFARTGELTDTTWIAADAIKFRSYADFLPVILKVEPTPTDCGWDC